MPHPLITTGTAVIAGLPNSWRRQLCLSGLQRVMSGRRHAEALQQRLLRKGFKPLHGAVLQGVSWRS